MSDDIDKEIAKRLHGIFPSEPIANKLVDIVTQKKPQGWGNKSNAPYFTEDWGNWLKKAIDFQIQTLANKNPQQIIFRVETFCSDGTTFNTLYTKVDQARRFLLEYLDPQGTYAKWYSQVNIIRDKEVGVIIEYKPEYRTGEFVPLQPDFVEPPETKTAWQQEIDDWLESSSVRPFVKRNLLLTEEEVNKLKLDLSRLAGIMPSITTSSILIIKTNS